MLFNNDQESLSINTYSIMTTLITQYISLSQSLGFNEAKEYKYTMRSLWGSQLYDICMDKASEVLKTNRDDEAQNLAEHYFLDAVSELATILKAIMPVDVGLLMPQYLRKQIGNIVTVQGVIKQPENDRQYSRNNKRYYQKYKNNEREMM